MMRSFTAHPFEDDWRDFATKAVRDYLQAAQGHVYVVGNPLQRDFLKVGKTGRTPEKRLAELNNEAVVGAFMLVASWEVLDRHYVEKAAHRALSCFARVKEFFQGHYEPVCAAVAKAVEEDRAVLARAGFR
ncbi:hypothetical protein APY03_0701 [Variovorax sp. WDL1]|nr:hypothetical protein APY03_0701 [Variovorax sp. WDL1]